MYTTFLGLCATSVAFATTTAAPPPHKDEFPVYQVENVRKKCAVKIKKEDVTCPGAYFEQKSINFGLVVDITVPNGHEPYPLQTVDNSDPAAKYCFDEIPYGSTGEFYENNNNYKGWQEEEEVLLDGDGNIKQEYTCGNDGLAKCSDLDSGKNSSIHTSIIRNKRLYGLLRVCKQFIPKDCTKQVNVAGAEFEIDCEFKGDAAGDIEHQHFTMTTEGSMHIPSHIDQNGFMFLKTSNDGSETNNYFFQGGDKDVLKYFTERTPGSQGNLTDAFSLPFNDNPVNGFYTNAGCTPCTQLVRLGSVCTITEKKAPKGLKLNDEVHHITINKVYNRETVDSYDVHINNDNDDHSKYNCDEKNPVPKFDDGSHYLRSSVSNAIVREGTDGDSGYGLCDSNLYGDPAGLYSQEDHAVEFPYYAKGYLVEEKEHTNVAKTVCVHIQKCDFNKACRLYDDNAEPIPGTCTDECKLPQNDVEQDRAFFEFECEIPNFYQALADQMNVNPGHWARANAAHPALHPQWGNFSTDVPYFDKAIHVFRYPSNGDAFSVPRDGLTIRGIPYGARCKLTEVQAPATYEVPENPVTHISPLYHDGDYCEDIVPIIPFDGEEETAPSFLEQSKGGRSVTSMASSFSHTNRKSAGQRTLNPQ